MTESQLMPWPEHAPIVPASASQPGQIVKHARQLTRRDARQIVASFERGDFETASYQVWMKAMAALKKQLATLGMDFVGEMLQRPDIGPASDPQLMVNDYDAILLAEQLGIATPTEAMRLRHAHETVRHFTELEGADQDDQEEQMNPEEAVGCLRACVQSILGHPRLDSAQNFADFRRRLEESTFDADDAEIGTLAQSPYFYRKTTLSILMALLKTSRGAQLEHVVRNTNVILVALWRGLRKPERWQTGKTYAELYDEGNKPAVAGLKSALVQVAGFDYVPENLRSNTYIAAAKAVLDAHNAFDNFYNEPGPMKKLASLGTTIPSPAFPVCMTATLCVRLGNTYGSSYGAQASATRVLASLSDQRWVYYLDECLPSDSQILEKLQHRKPSDRWIALVEEFGLQADAVRDRAVKTLLKASGNKEPTKVQARASRMRMRMYARR